MDVKPILGYHRNDKSPCEYPECKLNGGKWGVYAWYKRGKLKWICYRCAHRKAKII